MTVPPGNTKPTRSVDTSPTSAPACPTLSGSNSRPSPTGCADTTSHPSLPMSQRVRPPPQPDSNAADRRFVHASAPGAPSWLCPVGSIGLATSSSIDGC
ncbi:hypothetical protein FMEAI12_4030005 [Parafrankia sp. Ea1.12]|nr:hypothetical protein FMEAI12_4030005 [Parafrankia sp. Ea1.12]